MGVKRGTTIKSLHRLFVRLLLDFLLLGGRLASALLLRFLDLEYGERN